ncbi:DUF3040 domain-containing protein [Actinomadura rugatobispora]|uniref:DUF3040 domain-containing protein n=1 Tax=Actinomadura rugatobispora TaxID=1994 RepID=A0ABW0ZQA6_9ACTN|nr:hypothetical protein GCM10010200_101410 [Actinomadura rugatobispora]
MALSMEERRILAQIEVRLSEDDPRLAHRFAELGTSPPRRRRRRIRIIAAVGIALAVLAATVAAIATAIT